MPYLAAALLLLTIGGLCVTGAKYLIDEEIKSLQNRKCVCE